MLPEAAVMETSEEAKDKMTPKLDTKKLDESRPNPEKYATIKEYLPSFVKEIMDRPEKEKTGELVDFLVGNCVDKGTAREKQVFDDRGPATYVLARSAFIDYIEERYEDVKQAQGKIQIQIIDIKDFKKADMVLDEETGDKGADVVINKVAAKVMERIQVINDTRVERGLPGKVVACRYGGDEIAILFDDIQDDAFKSKSMEYILDPEEGVTSVDGYYYVSEDATREKAKVQIHEKEEPIEIPQDPTEAQIFWVNMKRGVLLTKANINDIKMFGESAFSAAEKPAEEQPVRETLDELTQEHYELRRPYEILKSLDYQSPEEEQHAMEGFREMIYRNFYSRLLGENVRTIPDFATHLIENEYKSITFVDTKIKEINDHISYMAGDDAIAGTFESIREALGPEGLRKVEIFQRGGMFIVAEKAADEGDESLTVDQREGLRSIKRVPVKYGDVTAEFYVGVKEAEVIYDQTPDTAAVKRYINEQMVESDKTWYRQFVLDNLDHPEYFQPREIPSKDEIIANKIDLSKPEYFIPMYLYGKRKAQRVNELLEAIDFLTTKGQIESHIYEDSDVVTEGRIGYENFENAVRIRNSVLAILKEEQAEDMIK